MVKMNKMSLLLKGFSQISCLYLIRHDIRQAQKHVDLRMWVSMQTDVDLRVRTGDLAIPPGGSEDLNGPGNLTILPGGSENLNGPGDLTNSTRGL